MEIKNKTRKQNYEQSVLLYIAMRFVDFEIKLEKDVVKIKVILENEPLCKMRIGISYLFKSTQYFMIIRELQSKLIQIPHQYYTPKGVKKLINDFEIKNFKWNKEHPEYDIKMFEFIEKKFEKFLEYHIKQRLEEKEYYSILFRPWL